MDDAKISGKVVYDDIWVGITTSADDEKGTISNESVCMRSLLNHQQLSQNNF